MSRSVETIVDEHLHELEKPSLVAEFLYFLKHEKKWWMGSTALILLVLSVCIFAAGGESLDTATFTQWVDGKETMSKNKAKQRRRTEVR